MRRDLLIAAGPGEWRAAWLEDGSAVELHVERGDVRVAGSVHLGRVVRRIGGLDGTLVDIGDERPGLLQARDARGAELTEGARVLVQVRREAQHDKGARLSLRIGEAEGQLAVRARGRDPPAQIDPAPGFAASLALRLPGGPDAILADDPAIVAELRRAFPDAEIDRRASAEWPLDWEAAFDAALSPSLALPGGGGVHIEEGRAAVLIDVDTGSPEQGSAERAALAVNLAAAATIARHLRLRQLGGGIVVDFAALDGRRPREQVRQAMAAALVADPARPQVLGWSRLGHLEIVRPRRLRPLSAAMLDPQSERKSAATLAFEALRALAREARARPATAWRLLAAPSVEAALRGPAAAGLQALQARLGRTIEVAAMPHGDQAAFDIVAS